MSVSFICGGKHAVKTFLVVKYKYSLAQSNHETKSSLERDIL